MPRPQRKIYNISAQESNFSRSGVVSLVAIAQHLFLTSMAYTVLFIVYLIRSYDLLFHFVHNKIRILLISPFPIFTLWRSLNHIYFIFLVSFSSFRFMCTKVDQNRSCVKMKMLFSLCLAYSHSHAHTNTSSLFVYTFVFGEKYISARCGIVIL